MSPRFVVRDLGADRDIFTSEANDDLYTIIETTRYLRDMRHFFGHAILLETENGARSLYHGLWVRPDPEDEE